MLEQLLAGAADLYNGDAPPTPSRKRCKSVSSIPGPFAQRASQARARVVPAASHVINLHLYRTHITRRTFLIVVLVALTLSAVQ